MRTVTEDRLTISPSNKLAKTSINRIEDLEHIPIDLIFEILLRLPAKSIAKCRSLSKLWGSILRRPDFTELFLTVSLARPQLLFSCYKNGQLAFFSSPQLQNSDENSSLVVAANHLKRFPAVYYDSFKICRPVRGLVCFTESQIVNRRKETMPVICNPSTGHSLNLPKVKTSWTVKVISFLGYDPIGKQFKILSMSSSYDGDEYAKEHQVLTLGTENPSWRMVDCCKPHYPADDGIFINGCLYYKAEFNGVSNVVCFDFKSEKFRIINRAEDAVLWWNSTLVNYKGRLGALMSDNFPRVSGESKYLELWVLEDPEKHEWSKHIHHVLPPLWKNVVGADPHLCCFGLIGCTNEIVSWPHYPSGPFYVLYYNFKRESFRRVEIQGMDARNNCRVYTFLDHVENPELM